jgi:hypothetical protein
MWHSFFDAQHYIKSYENFPKWSDFTPHSAKHCIPLTYRKIIKELNVCQHLTEMKQRSCTLSFK